MITSDDILRAMHEQRLLVLLENEEHTGFSQVLLDAKQFKTVSNATKTNCVPDASLKPGYEMCTMQVKDDVVIPIEHFEGMESIWYDEGTSN